MKLYTQHLYMFDNLLVHAYMNSSVGASFAYVCSSSLSLSLFLSPSPAPSLSLLSLSLSPLCCELQLTNAPAGRLVIDSSAGGCQEQTGMQDGRIL